MHQAEKTLVTFAPALLLTGDSVTTTRIGLLDLFVKLEHPKFSGEISSMLLERVRPR